MNLAEHETRIEIAGVALPAVIEYEPDEDGDILVCSVVIKRCTAKHGDIVYHKDGSYHQAYFPEFITLDMTAFIADSTIQTLADEIRGSLAADVADAKIRQEEDRWDAIMMSNYNPAPKHYEGMPV